MELLGVTVSSTYSRPKQFGFKMELPPAVSTSQDSYKSYVKKGPCPPRPIIITDLCFCHSDPGCPPPGSADMAQGLGPTCPLEAQAVCPRPGGPDAGPTGPLHKQPGEAGEGPTDPAQGKSVCPRPSAVGAGPPCPAVKGPCPMPCTCPPPCRCPPNCSCRQAPGLFCPPPGGPKLLPPLPAPLCPPLYPRCDHDDWRAANAEQFKCSDASLEGAVRFRKGFKRMAREKDQLTRCMQADSHLSIGKRLAQIHCCQSRVEQELEQLLAESCHLRRLHERLIKAVTETTKSPLHMSQECLFHRQKRMGVDLVHDTVEKKLLEEIAIIKCCFENMKALIGKLDAQIHANRSAQHELEKDLVDKKVAQDVDRKCFNLSNTSEDISYFEGVETKDRTVSVTETWCKFSDRNIQHSQCQRAASCQLRKEVETLMDISSAQLWAKFNEVNVAFNERVAEITETKNRLQVHLDKSIQETRQTEHAITLLKQAIKEKEIPQKVAQTCLQERNKRPNIELCRDEAQSKLVSEVYTIRETIQTLKVRLNDAENTLQFLANNRQRLQQDLVVKNNSLYIDKDLCMRIRQTFPSRPRLFGYTSDASCVS